MNLESSPILMQSASSQSLFVGRQAELAVLYGALEQAIAGSDRLVMLDGDAGMGKTRMARELAEQAARRGVPVLWGRCFEEPGAPPYWPWIQAIRTFLDTCDDAALRKAAGPGVAAIAGIVPELGERLQKPPASGTADSDQARFLLFQAIVLLWQNAARERALLLILDNLHWADPTSLRLLAFLASELGQNRLLVLGTYRHTELTRQHPLTETLAELTRTAHYVRLPLAGLNRADTERFICAASGVMPAPAVAAAIHERTEATPFT